MLSVKIFKSPFFFSLALTLSSPAFAQKALLIGDSIGMDGFTAALGRLGIQEGLFTEYQAYSACGYWPTAWAKNSHTNCGYREVHMKNGSESRNVYQKNGSTSSLATLLLEHKPEILFIQLGNNLFDAISPIRTQGLNPLQYASNWQSVISFTRPLVDMAVQSGTSVKECYWISPPDQYRASQFVQNFVLNVLKETVQPECTLIDSKSFTKVADYKDGLSRDGEHFLKEEDSIDWAEKVFASFKANRISYKEPLSKRFKDRSSKSATQSEGFVPFKALLKLRKKSPIPNDLKAVGVSYDTATAVYEWEILKVISGKYSEKTIRLVHPILVKWKPLPAADMAIGKELVTWVQSVPAEWKMIRRIDKLDVTPDEVQNGFLIDQGMTLEDIAQE